MDRKPVCGDTWSESSIERACRVGEEVYKRALSRHVPFLRTVKQDFHPQESDDDVDYKRMSLNETFGEVMGCLNRASRQCQKYHGSRQFDPCCTDSVAHYERFHKQVPVRMENPCQGNPLVRHERMRLSLPKGAYSITADKPGSSLARTTNIYVRENRTYTHELYFTL